MTSRLCIPELDSVDLVDAIDVLFSSGRPDRKEEEVCSYPFFIPAFCCCNEESPFEIERSRRSIVIAKKTDAAQQSQLCYPN
mmetsp:Transcript_4823/g.7334  ORF Transcript_4823/g.7334 Transcript_4823/m.7334 type:complete len:82 (-) Transcript_4823:36-281(-)